MTIKQWGGWELFQLMLSTLKTIGERYSVSLSVVGTRWVLEQQAVGSVVIGVRPGVSNHAKENAKAFGFFLSLQDKEEISAVQSRSRNLFELIGDCGDEYRG